MINSALTLAQLRALVAVMDEGGVGRAAARLGVAQSAVSQQLASMERVVGGALLDRHRGPRRATPTPLAALVADAARTILGGVDALAADVVAFHAVEGERVRLGCFMSVGARVVPPVLAHAYDRRPGLALELTERDSDEDLLDEVAASELDLAITTLPPRPGPFRFRDLLSDPHVLVLPAGHPLASRRRTPRPEEIAALGLIGFRNDFTEEYRLDAILRERGLDARIVLRTDNNLAIPELVALGLGVAVLPRLALPDVHGDDRLVVIDLPESLVPPRRIGICWHAQRRLTPAAEAVIEIAAEVCAEIASASPLAI